MINNNLKEIQIVIFLLGNNYYGIDIFKIKEIVFPPEKITEIPNSKPYVKGVTKFRGKAISIVDLRKRFGMSDLIITKDTRIIMTNIQNKILGIMVESVSEVFKLNVSEIDQSSEVHGGIEADYLHGLGHLDDKLILILDPDKIFSSNDVINI